MRLNIKLVISLQIVDHRSEFVTTLVLKATTMYYRASSNALRIQHNMENDVLKKYLRAVHMQDINAFTFILCHVL